MHPAQFRQRENEARFPSSRTSSVFHLQLGLNIEQIKLPILQVEEKHEFKVLNGHKGG